MNDYTEPARRSEDVPTTEYVPEDVVEDTPDVDFDDASREAIAKWVAEAPKFRPTKALSASAKAQFTAALVALDEMGDELKTLDDGDIVNATEILAALLASLERALRIMAVSTTAYDSWSARLPEGIAVPAIIEVFQKQNLLVGK